MDVLCNKYSETSEIETVIYILCHTAEAKEFSCKRHERLCEITDWSLPSISYVLMAVCSPTDMMAMS